MKFANDFTLADVVIGYDKSGNSFLLKNHLGHVNAELTPEIVGINYYVSLDRPEVKKVLIRKKLQEIDS